MKKVLLALCGLMIAFFSSAQLPKLNLVQIASGFLSPVDIKNCGDNRIFVVEQAGKIRIMDKSGNIRSTPFLDISSHVLSVGNEQGLLSVAFSPNYKVDSCFYVNYITGTGNGSTVISRFHVSADSNVADAGSEKVLLTFTQPYTNHNGATLMFGPDGYLYDTQGDGGNAGDPYHMGQNKNVFLGKILRMDVNHPDTTYLIPPTNPFVDSLNTKHEIWAYGVRNPWRCSFDRLTGDMWIGDVGQNLYEEVDFQPAASTGGEDYGWNCREGFHPYDTSCANSTGFIDPIFEYVHSTGNGCSITGGYVYRGAQFSRLFGRYFFTDFCSGRFIGVRQTSPGVFAVDTFHSFLTNMYSTFGQDNDYEMYIAGRSNGKIYHLTDTANCQPVAYIMPDSFENCNQVKLTALVGDSLNYQWYNSSGALNGSSSQYIATTTGWYKVKVAKAQLGCESFSDSVYVTVHGPDVLIDSIPIVSYCTSDTPVLLDGFITPAGGVYTGAAVVNGFFDPASGLVNDTVYYTYTNSYGCISQDTFTVVVRVCVGLNEVKDDLLFNVYPNPNNGVVNVDVRTENSQQVRLIVTDALGKIYSKMELTSGSSPKTVPVDLSSLSKGVYLLKLSGESGIKGKLLVVE
ncbi:MAG: hypothetical protein JWO06_2487 [Bacteroidota bacterium]|nr:hypothetical protein [Bacteroidota bacterium]